MYIYQEGGNPESGMKRMIQDYVSQTKHKQVEGSSMQSCCPREGEICLEAQHGWLPLGLDAAEEAAGLEQQALIHLYSQENAALYPYVRMCVEEMDYEGSPIYDSHFGRDVLNRMVDTVEDQVMLQQAESNRNLPEGYSSDRRMRRALIEALLLNEIFGNRRPRQNRRRRRSYYYSPHSPYGKW